MERVSAIVVTYNRKEKLVNCIEKLLSQTEKCDILVVDNASTDNTKEEISARFGKEARVIYENTGKNIGGAGGFSYGLHRGTEMGYSYFWLMDDDCLPEENALFELLAQDEKLSGDYGFLSSAVYFTDGSLCNMNIQKTGLRKKVTDLSSERVNVIMATFVSFFIPRERVTEFGLPIKEFFIWSDDLEYSRRISKKYPSYLVPSSRVVHDMASNLKVNIATDSESRLPRYSYLYRNEVYVYRREGIGGWIYLFTRVIFHIMKILVSGTGSKTKKIKTVLSSFFAGFRFHPETEYVDGGKK